MLGINDIIADIEGSALGSHCNILSVAGRSPRAPAISRPHDPVGRPRALHSETLSGDPALPDRLPVADNHDSCDNYITDSQQNCQPLRNAAASGGEPVGAISGARRAPGSVALAGLGREVFVELAFFALVLVGVGRRVLLVGDVGPFGRERGVELEPLLEPALGIGQDRLGRAFGLAHAAVDAFAGIDDQHVLALVEAVDRADLDAVHILARMQASVTT